MNIKYYFNDLMKSFFANFYQVKWQPVPGGVFKEPVINYQAVSNTAAQEQQKCEHY